MPGAGGRRLIVDVDAASALAVASRERVDVVGFVRRLDWLLLLAVAALVGYGLWAIAGITRFDVAGRPELLRRPAGDRRRRSGSSGFARRARDRPGPSTAAHWRVDLRRHDRLMLLVFAARRRDARLEALDRPRPVPVPAVRVRQAALRARARRLPRRPRRAGSASPSTVAARRSGSRPCRSLLVFLQPDLGTALVYAAALTAVLFVAGVRWLAPRRARRRCAALVVASVALVPARRRASRC